MLCRDTPSMSVPRLFAAVLIASLLLAGGPLRAQGVDGPFFVIEEPVIGYGTDPGIVEPFDLDAWLSRQHQPGHGDGPWHGCCPPGAQGPWDWQFVPTGILYKSYLAGAHEPRLGSAIFRDLGDRRLWDTVLGGRVGIIRYGSPGGGWADGFQLDVEGAAFVRLDADRELESTDFRAGLPLTYKSGNYSTKLAYYHISSHLGDEFLAKNEDAERIDFVRDVIVWGHSLQWTDDLRVYFEVGYGLHNKGGSEPWEFQFGAEYSSVRPTGNGGSPFLAANGHLREEVGFGGNLVAQAGWQWRSVDYGPLFRMGVHYYNGKSAQFEFFDHFEHQLGFGIWYDF